VTTRAEVEFGDREVSEGSQTVDYGFDFLELGRGRRLRIVGQV
jgi:hypothetical protein